MQFKAVTFLSIAGVYVCGFTNGAVMHRAEAQLKVARLPDRITLRIKPLTADCSQGDGTVDVDVTATISNSTESFSVWWSYMGDRMSDLFNTCREKQNVLCSASLCSASANTKFHHMTH